MIVFDLHPVVIFLKKGYKVDGGEENSSVNE